jgi:hypothetical protein
MKARTFHLALRYARLRGRTSRLLPTRETAAMTTWPHRVFTISNSRFTDHDEDTDYGAFFFERNAIRRAKRIVDTELVGYPGATAEKLFSLWIAFGETPIVSGSAFNSVTYARERAREIASR